MSDEICVNLANHNALQVKTDAIKQDLINLALEFGQKCSVFSMLDNIMKDSGLGALFEKTLKTIMDGLSKLYNGIRTIIETIGHMIQPGVDLLLGAIQSSLDLISDVLTQVNGLIDQAVVGLAKGVNALASALCSTLSSAVTGVPSDVTLQSPELLVLAYADANDPRGFLEETLRRQGINNLNSPLTNQLARLNNFGNLGNFNQYICIPV